jgi:hypothetical protein
MMVGESAGKVGVDPSTLARWERGASKHHLVIREPAGVGWSGGFEKPSACESPLQRGSKRRFHFELVSLPEQVFDPDSHLHSIFQTRHFG